MNILFVNYGDFTTNSLNHIGGFANTLCADGHACVVAVSHAKETLAGVHRPLFIPATYEEVLSRPALFPNNKPADIVHAWTPREGVRKFVLAYQRALAVPARVVIHLEDNERFLLEAFTGSSFDQLRSTPAHEINTWLVDGLSHPLRHEAFLRIADGVTHIIDRLVEFAPAGTPAQLVPPGVDFSLYHPQAANSELRAELGLAPDEHVLVFTGSNTFANESEMRELYLAVALLNQRGIRTKLVRTGFNSPTFLANISDDVKRHVLDLGFIEKAKLPQLLALAEVLVQPGRPGAFNDYRLPSKLPEFFAMGKAVILPPTNIALHLQDGRDAVFLRTGSPEEIACACERLFADATMRAQLGTRAVAFAHEHFDVVKNSRVLADFYSAIASAQPRVQWALARDPFSTESTLLAAQLLAKITELGHAGAPLAAEIDLLVHVVRDLEIALDSGRNRGLEAERDRLRKIVELTQQHVQNLERQAEDRARSSRQHIQDLEKQAAERDRLTQQHIRDLEHQAAERTRLSNQHIANIENQLATVRQGYADAMGAIEHHQRRAEAAEQAAEKLQAQLRQLQTQLGALEASLAQAREETIRTRNHFEDLLARERHAAEALLKNRDDKIARMQQSISWRATAPFRALRRVLFDRSKAATTLSDKILGNIDFPQDWTIVPPTLNIRGWSLHRDKTPIKAVRAHLGKRTVPAQFGLERLDVLDHFRDFPAAEHSGWMLKLEVPRLGKHRLTLEAQDESGAWHAFFSRDVRRTAKAPPPPPNSYAAWAATYDTLTVADADRIREKLKGLSRRPLISVLMPVYNVDAKWLIAAIESVRRQLYENWELCIADDASPAPHVRKILAGYLKKDRRIKVVFRETNGHISATSNSALALAHGEFIALLDHDDELRPHALACVALELERHPQADLIYSDEDKIDENGHRYDHYFKPDWNPDLFNVQNYISHLGVYRTLLVREVGGFRVGYEGSQDWDLAMRVIERTAPDRIRHIPKILYHWRSVPGSTAMLIGAKNYAVTAAEKVIREHLTRTGVTASITPTKGSYWRIHYSVPDPAPRVSLIIPTRNRLNVLGPCIDSILEKTTYPNYEVIIVDNDSDDPATLDYLSELGRRFGGRESDSTARSADQEGGGAAVATQRSTLVRVRVLRSPGEFNFSALNNYAVAHTDSPLVGLLNNDLEIIHGDWLHEMVSHALRPEIGCVGAKLYYPNDRIQHAGVILGIGGVAAHAWQTHPRGTAGQSHRALLQQNLSAVTAACLVIRREIYLRVGGFEAEKLKVAFNDVDFCLKVRAAGYWNLWTPHAELYHHESASRGAEDTLEKRDRFRSEVEYMMTKWGDTLQNDPAYNPNLTLAVNDFTLAVPPRPWPALS